MSETPDERAARLRAQALDAPTISDAEFRDALAARVPRDGRGRARRARSAGRLSRAGPQDGGIPAVLRDGPPPQRAPLAQPLLADDRLAPTFARSDVGDAQDERRLRPRRRRFDADAWRMRVAGPDGALLDVLDLDDLRRLPAARA